TKFSPNQSLTRAQFAAMLVRALSLESTQGTAFTDVDGEAWYASAIAAAYQHGLVNGRGKDTFSPNAAITREELAVMLYRAYRTRGNASSLAEAPDLKDKQQISPWAVQAVKEALSVGLMKGHANSTFTPNANTTRAESAQAVLYLLNQVK
ncbi:pullulanase, partial [Clostridium perfringens]